MDFDLELYNSLGRRLEPFRPLRPGIAHVYTCGPTVYGDIHIGNMRTFVLSDLVKRVLEYAGYEVVDAMNITDVGHLTSDADEGEDKLARAAAEQRRTAWEIAEQHTKEFFEEAELLNILPKRHVVKATDHIAEQIELARQLEARGVTYRTGDGLYFDTTRLDDYGKLTPAEDRTRQLAGARVAVGEKRTPTDFAVWKFSPEGTRRDMEWESPWGTGFPGWHLECSAMAMKYLGETLDIHIGGIDLLPTHHTNEIAQSETATGKQFVRFWLHGEFLLLPGDEKMARSEGNIITVRSLRQRGYDPLAFRYLVLLSHYRKPLDFSFEGLDAAATAFARLRERTREFAAAAGNEEPPALDEAAQAHRDCFIAALGNDLNTPQALACVWQLVRATDVAAAAKHALLADFDRVLGLDLDAPAAPATPIPDDIVALAERRAGHRRDKEWAESDRLRDQITAAGYDVIDTADGYRLQRREDR